MKGSWHPYTDHLILIGLTLLCYLLFFHQLGNIGFLGPDEPRYAAVAREMYLTGDYITPRLHGEKWFEKPPLMYWGAAAGYRIFGINEWGARFPSALGASICVFLVYFCGRRLWDRTAGLLAAVVLATSIGFFSFARAASMDMPLTACLTAALVGFLIGSNSETSSRRWWFYLFYAALGLGVLAKGPVAVILPAVSLGGYLLLRGTWHEWKSWHPEGILLTLLIALPWYIACWSANGYEFIEVFIINHNLQRFTSTVHGHQRPIYFYIPVLLLLTFPWTLLLIPALRRSFGKNEQLLAWWAIVQFVFFSVAGSKLPGYILPMVPPIALLCAKELLQPASRSFRTAAYVEAGLLGVIGIAFGFFGSMLNVNPHVSGTLILGVTLIMGVLLTIIALWLKPWFLAVFNGATMLTLVIVATSFVFPRFNSTDTMRPWDTALRNLVPDTQQVFLYKPDRWMEYGLQFYREDRAQGVWSPDDLLKVVETQERVLCIAADGMLDELSRLGNVDMEVVQSIGNQTALWVWLVR